MPRDNAHDSSLERTRRLMDAVKRIELGAARAVDTRLTGSYHSVFKGHGVVFSEVRRYEPGDDVASIDWNVSARMNQPHIKLFSEDRDQTVLLLVDISGSAHFGSQHHDKHDVAAELSALLAFAATKNNDQVGLILFTDRIEHVLMPRKGRRHALRLVRDILAHEPRSRGTDLSVGLTYAHKAARHRALVFVISDFLDRATWETPLRVTSRRHDVVPVVIRDPMEEALPDLGLVTVEDLETGQLLEFDTSGPEAHEYIAQVAEMRARHQRAFRRCALDAIDIRTDRPYLGALLEFFRVRAKRMKHA